METMQFDANDLRLAIESVQAHNDASLDCDSLVMEFGKKSDGASSQCVASKFLAIICGFRLKSEDSHAPFEPAIKTTGWTSPTLDDISADQASALQTLLPAVKLTDLRARIGDLVWLKRRDHQCAASAVESYRSMGETLVASGEVLGVKERFERALQLGLFLGRNGNSFKCTIESIERLALDSLNLACIAADCLRLLLKYGGERFLEYASAAESRARGNTGPEKSHIWVRSFWELAAVCYSKLNDVDSAHKARLHVARSFEEEAEEVRKSSHAGKHMVAAHFLEQSLHVYRQIPGTEGDRQRVHLQIVDDNRKGQSEFFPTPLEPIDVGDIIELSRSRVRGRDKRTALATLVVASHWLKKDDVELRAAETVRQYPLSSLFGTTRMSSTAKAAAHAPGAGRDGQPIPKDLLTLRMCDEYRSLFPITVSGQIDPIRDQLMMEHQVNWSDLIEFVAYSPLVPPGREGLFVEGLLHGLRRRLVESLHILVPQVEHALRCDLHAQGVVTSSLDDDGVEQEFDLNRILWMPELEEIFGCDVVFVLRVLLIERFGYNLRNEMAHGMLGQHRFFEPEAVYLWWLIFHLVGKPTAITILAKEADVDDADAQTTGPTVPESDAPT